MLLSSIINLKFMLKIVGDINFSDGYFDTGFGVGSTIKTGIDPFANLHREDGDYWIGNFECVCAELSNKSGAHAKQFRISPQDLKHFKHLDLYGVANNHVMQHGEAAYNEMLENIRAFSSECFGADKKRHHTFLHQGKNITIIGFNQRPENFCKAPLYWAMPEYSEIAKEYDCISDSDFKIAYIHWGNEFMNYPYNDQRQFAHYLIDLGFDLIVGMHPHVMQGFEIYKGKHIFYSLGNCVFNMAWEPTKYAIMLSVDLSEDIPQVDYNYLKLVNYFPQVVEENDVPPVWQLPNLNKLLNHKQLPENEKYYRKVFEFHSQHKKANRKKIISQSLFKLSFADVKTMMNDFISRKLK